MSVSQNIMARQEAESLIELAGDQPERFWETLRNLAAAKLPPAVSHRGRHVQPEAPALRQEQEISGEAVTQQPGDAGEE